MSRNHRKPISRVFPTYHPRAGEPTYFVEKIWKSIGWVDYGVLLDNNLKFIDSENRVSDIIQDFARGIESKNTIFAPKHHTIREKGANPVKVGDTLTLFSWSGRPYHTPQIVIAPQIEVKQVWDFDIDLLNPHKIYLNGHLIYDGDTVYSDIMDYIADHDGLDLFELLAWFKYPKKSFLGQIICWSDDIQY